MQPSDFLASLERHQEAQATQPDPAEEFAKAQFQRVVDAVMSANKALLGYMKSQATPKSISVDNLPKFPSSIKTPDVTQVTKAIQALETALKPVKQDNTDVVSAIKELSARQVSAQDIAQVVKAPVVNVDAPDLTPIKKAIEDNKPEPIDLSKVVSALKDVSQQIIKKPTPVANTPTDPLIYYLPADIDDAGTVQYFGYTDNKGAWYIRKFDTSTSPKTIRFSFGQASYTTNWTNRASLSYGLWGS